MRRLVKNGHWVEPGGCFGGAVGQKPNWSSVEREQRVRISKQLVKTALV